MDDDWDSIDWDKKVEDIKVKQQREEEKEQEAGQFNFRYCEVDGNYFEANQEKKEQKSAERNKNEAPRGSRNDDFVQAYSHKDLNRILNLSKSSVTFGELVYATYGQLERFLLTHQDPDLADETIVELLMIDSCLLKVPFHAHNQLFLAEISRLSSFWAQLTKFLHEFLSSKHKDLKFLLTVDMNGFLENIEILLHSLLVNNHFNLEISKTFKDMVLIMDSFDENQWSCGTRLRSLHEQYERNRDVFKIYDIFPSLDDFTTRPNILANLVNGCYDNVAHYLQIHLPLLKEDFLSKLRNGVQQIKAMEAITNIVKTPNVFIFPNVQIKALNKFMWNMNCRVIVVKLNAPQKSAINWSRRFFNGQLLCFSSSKEFVDLIIATVIHREPSDGPPEEITVEIVKTENISEIFDRDLLMIESSAFFEPYNRVFNVLKNHNEVNFPFKSQILKLVKIKKFPNYQHQDCYSYQDFTFNVKDTKSWPKNTQLNLEEMQLKAIQEAVTSDLTIIQGPPGTGKTFVGLEILRILLENTNETILILTQTNNALDKFLLGASKFTDSIARMGGQCKCEELEKFIVKISTPFESKQYMKKLQAQHRVKVEQKSDEISTYHRLIEEIHQLSAFSSINNKRVIGMTTTFAARSTSINKIINPGVVIVEEASEVLESHVLVSLTRETKQLIMIGDHQQLKPLTNSYELAKNSNFNVSLFERLIRNDFDFTTLDVQMRMSQEICDLVRGTIYKSLKDGANVEKHPSVKGMTTSFFCVNHASPESLSDGETSKENPFEAKYACDLTNHLIEKGNDPAQIIILTAYAAQAQSIKNQLKHPVRVAVLDAFQGEESDIIILSLVRSNSRREIGFLSSENRIAVVLSRAKFGFYIVANMDCLASASGVWRQIMEILKEKKVIGKEIPGVKI